MEQHGVQHPGVFAILLEVHAYLVHSLLKKRKKLSHCTPRTGHSGTLTGVEWDKQNKVKWNMTIYFVTLNAY